MALSLGTQALDKVYTVSKTWRTNTVQRPSGAAWFTLIQLIQGIQGGSHCGPAISITNMTIIHTLVPRVGHYIK